MAALRAGAAPEDAAKLEWSDYHRWLDPMLWQPGRWAIIPDIPSAPSQLNDGLLNDWPYGRSRGAPVWHMDGPIERLGRLCERYDRVCLGWIGDPKREPVGCDAYRRKMDEVAQLMGNHWHPLHMLRGIKVAFDYPFIGADSTSLAQNGHRYDWIDAEDPVVGERTAQWTGRNRYADRLERKHGPDWRIHAYLLSASRGRRAASRPHMGHQSVVPDRQLRFEFEGAA
jgi:hypothetical protein